MSRVQDIDEESDEVVIDSDTGEIEDDDDDLVDELDALEDDDDDM